MIYTDNQSVDLH